MVKLDNDKDNYNEKPKGFGKPKPGVCVPCWERRQRIKQKKRREEAKNNGNDTLN